MARTMFQCTHARVDPGALIPFVVAAVAARAKPRGITEDKLVKGARIVGAATVVEAIAAGRVPVAIG